MWLHETNRINLGQRIISLSWKCFKATPASNHWFFIQCCSHSSRRLHIDRQTTDRRHQTRCPRRRKILRRSRSAVWLVRRRIRRRAGARRRHHRDGRQFPSPGGVEQQRSQRSGVCAAAELWWVSDDLHSPFRWLIVSPARLQLTAAPIGSECTAKASPGSTSTLATSTPRRTATAATHRRERSKSASPRPSTCHSTATPSWCFTSSPQACGATPACSAWATPSPSSRDVRRRDLIQLTKMPSLNCISFRGGLPIMT